MEGGGYELAVLVVAGEMKGREGGYPARLPGVWLQEGEDVHHVTCMSV